jgi:NADPH:quinone reductase-like Zn-dependent oxidoreductase
MKAVQISRHGLPLEVVELIDLDEPPSPGPSEVLIEMLYSPINPFDLRIMRAIASTPCCYRV